MSEGRITGALAAAATPLRDGGERLDEDAIGPLLDFYGASGLDGVLALGTTGEGILLARGERQRLAELMLASAGELSVIVHCGAQTTTETTELAAHAAQAGADGVAVIAPPYFPFADDELVAHFVAAAKACAPLPFYVYEYADRSGYAVPPAVIERIRERASNLVGMKVSDTPFERIEPYLATGLDVFVGAEVLLPQGLASGAVGGVSGVGAAFPELISALVHEPTDELAAVVGSVRAAMSERPFQAAVKAVLGMRGLPVRADVRAPLRPVGEGSARRLRGELERLLGVESLARPLPVPR